MDGDEFDSASLDRLSEDLGRETFIFLIGRCAEDVRERLDKLNALPDSPERPEQARRLAHQLKGLFLQFGADRAAQDAAALEACATETFDAGLAELSRSATRALAFFEARRDASA